MSGNDRAGNRFEGKCEQQGNDDKVIDLAHDRNEVRDQIDRRKQVRYGEREQQFGVSWCFRITENSSVNFHIPP